MTLTNPDSMNKSELRALVASQAEEIAGFKAAIGSGAHFIATYDIADHMPHGLMTGEQWSAFAGIHIVVGRIVDAIESHSITPLP